MNDQPRPAERRRLLVLGAGAVGRLQDKRACPRPGRATQASSLTLADRRSLPPKSLGQLLHEVRTHESVRRHDARMPGGVGRTRV